MRESLTQLQSYSWRRLAKLRGRGWSRDRLRRFRPWEVPTPPRPAPPSTANPVAGGSHWVSGPWLWVLIPGSFLGGGRVFFENMDSGTCLPEFKPQLCQFLAVWTSCQTSCLDFFTFKLGIIKIHTSRVIAKLKLVNSYNMPCVVPGT